MTLALGKLTLVTLALRVKRLFDVIVDAVGAFVDVVGDIVRWMWMLHRFGDQGSVRKHGGWVKTLWKKDLLG